MHGSHRTRHATHAEPARSSRAIWRGLGRSPGAASEGGLALFGVRFVEGPPTARGVCIVRNNACGRPGALFRGVATGEGFACRPRISHIDGIPCCGVQTLRVRDDDPGSFRCVLPAVPAEVVANGLCDFSTTAAAGAQDQTVVVARAAQIEVDRIKLPSLHRTPPCSIP